MVYGVPLFHGRSVSLHGWTSGLALQGAVIESHPGPSATATVRRVPHESELMSHLSGDIAPTAGGVAAGARSIGAPLARYRFPRGAPRRLPAPLRCFVSPTCLGFRHIRPCGEHGLRSKADLTLIWTAFGGPWRWMAFLLRGSRHGGGGKSVTPNLIWVKNVFLQT